MEASTGAHQLPTTTTSTSIDPLSETIKKRLLQKGVNPTPKIIHTLRKKHLQKSLRKSKSLISQSPLEPLTQSQQDTLAHELYFQNVSKEYKEFSKVIDSKSLAGKPWESLESVNSAELANGYLIKEGNFDGKLKFEHLRDLGLVFEERKMEALSMFLDDDDVEVDEGSLVGENGNWSPFRRRTSEADAIRILVNRLTAREITMKDWKFTRMMKQSALQFTENQMLRIVGGIGEKGCWRQAMEVVGWVYSRKDLKLYKSRFVYTKLLAVLQRGRRPYEALRIFNHMRGDCYIYPDMAAYHTIAVTLGQAGMVRELMSLIECMKEKPSKSIKNMRRRHWDLTLQPDVVIFNSVLNACVPTHHWKGVAWVFQQLRKGGLHANSATYGLAMEVMLQSSKYDLVHQLFEKMKRNSKSPNALTYKVLVRTFWKEDKVDEAIHIVRQMEQSGIMGSASVYYELACCLCNKGRWQEAKMEIDKLKKLRHSRPLTVTFTGMILSSMDGGHVDDCISIFEQMQQYCHPDIGVVNAMLKVYGRYDMFLEAKGLFEKAERSVTKDISCLDDENTPLAPDMYTYVTMLEISGHAQQWEYFEYVYKEMCLCGYQLDQAKHAGLLVEASKAGKWHLLEHAFDTTLEAGEIPEPMLFSEMLCQAMLQHDYKKAITIVNTMAYAPFQFDKKVWIALFEKNKDRINNDHLKNLSDTLGNCGISQEFTALELVKALQSICGPLTVQDPCSSSSDGDSCKSFIHENPNSARDNKLVSVTQSGDWIDVNAEYEDCDSDGDDGVSSSLCTDFRSLVDDVACKQHKFTVFDELHSPDDSDFEEAEAREDSELSSAEEILQSWMEMRKTDETKTNVV
ncbi:pentatricopeptide repeat-containing protein At5g67570, chloroplastic isoform X1 [Silene latifolia]|uniref:pentatricopeptide repeat-containing protein At5g67570, chloroplastic isoform X1 n=1 Tax=Silene latifolia TaxID=37657 RepID=UPI003D776FA0